MFCSARSTLGSCKGEQEQRQDLEDHAYEYQEIFEKGAQEQHPDLGDRAYEYEESFGSAGVCWMCVCVFVCASA